MNECFLLVCHIAQRQALTLAWDEVPVFLERRLDVVLGFLLLVLIERGEQGSVNAHDLTAIL